MTRGRSGGAREGGRKFTILNSGHLLRSYRRSITWEGDLPVGSNDAVIHLPLTIQVASRRRVSAQTVPWSRGCYSHADARQAAAAHETVLSQGHDFPAHETRWKACTLEECTHLLFLCSSCGVSRRPSRVLSVTAAVELPISRLLSREDAALARLVPTLDRVGAAADAGQVTIALLHRLWLRIPWNERRIGSVIGKIKRTRS